MDISLSKLLLEDGKTMELSVESEMTELKFQMGKYKVKEKKPIHLVLTNLGNKNVSIAGTTEITFMIPCGRCLQPVAYTMELDMQRDVDLKLPEEEQEAALEEESFIHGEQLDPEILLRNEILLNWPIRVLCKDDCKGICSRCGANLNTAACNCAQEPKDPRMAAIQDIFSKFKEV